MRRYRLASGLFVLFGCAGADASFPPSVAVDASPPPTPPARGDAGTSPAVDGGARDDDAAIGEDGGLVPADCDAIRGAAGNASQWVTVGGDGKLAYKALDKGDHILDFSHAGYGGGGVAIPSAAVKQTLAPSGGDDTAAIQAAIDAVSKLPQNGGIRGAVLLAAGTFILEGSLSITTSGVVLRGSGSGPQGTKIDIKGSPRTLFRIEGTGDRKTTGTPATITDDYVPSGASKLHVDDASRLAVGDTVLVARPVTGAWVHFMGMDTLVRNGAPQTWIKVGTTIRTDRVIAAIVGNEVTLDVPLTDSLDGSYVKPPGATVTRYTFTGRIADVGLESMSVSAPSSSVPLNQASFQLLRMDAVIDAWVKDVAAQGMNNGLSIGGGAKRVTLEGTSFVHTAPIDGSAGYPADFSLSGQQILLSRCSTEGDHVFSVVTQALEPGPNVVLNLTAKGTSTNVAPHQRWATGFLLDGYDSKTGGVDFINRKTAGSGHGWSIGFGVVWNANAARLNIQNPPGSMNWVIGSTGKLTADATSVDSPGKAVTPQSLYLAQLCDRLGPKALSNIGY